MHKQEMVQIFHRETNVLFCPSLELHADHLGRWLRADRMHVHANQHRIQGFFEEI